MGEKCPCEECITLAVCKYRKFSELIKVCCLIQGYLLKNELKTNEQIAKFCRVFGGIND